jgi:hypothetical protein
MQAKVGPSMLPGRGRSETPPDQRSTSLGCLDRTMSTGREAQVPHVLEYGGVLPDRLVGHRAEQLLETVGSGEAAELAELHVAGYSELATPLHVQADQVHAEAGSGFFEQMVCHLLGDGVVHGLRHLVHQSHEVLVEYPGAVQVVGATDQIGEALGG